MDRSAPERDAVDINQVTMVRVGVVSAVCVLQISDLIGRCCEVLPIMI